MIMVAVIALYILKKNSYNLQMSLCNNFFNVQIGQSLTNCEIFSHIIAGLTVFI